jgi:succinoglycan biosynthesis transport protein ExoP
MKSTPSDAGVGEPLEPWRAAWSARDEQTNELLWLLQALRLRWKMIIVVAMLLTGSAAFVLRQVTPLYSATADILIDAQQPQYADLSAGPGPQTTVWPAELETYIKVVWSDPLAREVVRSVGPALFKEPPSPWQRVRAWIARVRAAFGEWLQPLRTALEPWLGPPRDGLAAETAVEQAVHVFHQYLDVQRDSLAAALYVTYRAPDPVFAARVANATADAFPRELVRSQKAALAATASYLEERVAALGRELELADIQMRELQNKMSTVDGESISEMRFRELIQATSEAEAQVVLAKENVARIEALGSEGLSDAVASKALAVLLDEDRRLSSKLAEIASEFGHNHPAMLALQAEQANVRRSIRAEEARIREQSRKELETSEARVAWLRQELAEVEKKLALDMDDQVQLKQLMTRTESTRLLYQDILTRYQRASEQQLMVTTRARVINVARPPSKPDRRKVHLVFAAASCGSLVVGAGLALLLELRRRGFRSSDDLALETGLPVLGALPHIGRNSLSVYVEAARRLGLHVCPVSDPESGKVILVSSALPSDGKTIVSLSLARQLANARKRVVLIDADLHRRGLQELLRLTVFPRVGITALLASPETNLESAIVRDTRSGADLILALDPAEDPGQLVASPRMAEILRMARRHYDVVIIDTPPVLAVSEATSLAAFADRMLLVVRSESTPRKAVLAALKELRAISNRPLGLVLNGIRLGRTYARYAHSDQLAYYRASARYLKT